MNMPPKVFFSLALCAPSFTLSSSSSARTSRPALSLRIELGGGHQIGHRLVEVAHAQARLPAPEVRLERGGLEQQRRVARLDGVRLRLRG